MPAKPPLYRQETDYSCAPACLRMVLAGAGIEKSEEDLREISDCTIEGTDALKIVDAARSLGFTNSRKFNLEFDDLKSFLSQNIYPIVYLKLRLGTASLMQQHAVVIIEVRQENLLLYDPVRGEIEIDKPDFLQSWNAMRRLALIIH